jgi:acyl carrier protein
MSNAKSDEVMSVIFDVLSPLEVSADSRLGDVGANSVLLLRLMTALQRKFNVVLSVVDMFSVDDVGDLVRLVEERMPREGVAST